MLFWSDWGQYPRIERISMDGDQSTRKAIVQTGIKWPNGITLDYERRLLYWVDASDEYKQLSVSDWEGNDRRSVDISTRAGVSPFPFAVTTYMGAQYWSDWELKSLSMTNLTSLGPGSSRPALRQIPVRGSGKNLELMDVKVYDPSRQVTDFPVPCLDEATNPCSHLCLAASNPKGYSCACPTGKLMKAGSEVDCEEAFSEILLLSRKSDIRVISLDTPDFSDILIEVDSPYEVGTIALDYDPVNQWIFWSDPESGVYRANLDGSGYKVIVDPTEEVRNQGGICRGQLY